MIGPTGVGKTEIARRLARLANAPFVKVEATKFTEVGYVGREVDSIVKDLVGRRRQDDARAGDGQGARSARWTPPRSACSTRCCRRPRMIGFSSDEPRDARDGDTRQRFRKMLREGQLDDREIEIELRALPVRRRDHGAAGHGGTARSSCRCMFSEPGRQPYPHAQGSRCAEAFKLLTEEEAGKAHQRG